MPLYADRRTFVRAHVQARRYNGVDQSANNVKARLVLSQGAKQTTLTPVRADSDGKLTGETNGRYVGATPDRDTLSDSFLFELPPDLIHAGTLSLELQADGPVPIGCETVDSPYQNCVRTVTFGPPVTATIRFFSLIYRDLVGDEIPVTSDDFRKNAMQVRRALPLSDVESPGWRGARRPGRWGVRPPNQYLLPRQTDDWHRIPPHQQRHQEDQACRWVPERPADWLQDLLHRPPRRDCPPRRDDRSNLPRLGRRIRLRQRRGTARDAAQVDDRARVRASDGPVSRQLLR